jgi:hypothetical protein
MAMRSAAAAVVMIKLLGLGRLSSLRKSLRKSLRTPCSSCQTRARLVTGSYIKAVSVIILLIVT